MYPNIQEKSPQAHVYTEYCLSDSDDNCNDYKIGDFLDLSITNEYENKSDEKPEESEANSSRIVTISFMKIDKASNAKVRKKKKRNGYLKSLEHCSICNKLLNSAPNFLDEEAHNQES